MNQKRLKQTKLVLGALASGAAALNPALSPVRKLGGLAGFCLGLLRTRPGRCQKRPARMQKGYRKDVRQGAVATTKGGRRHG
ncbi:hypothetical protein ESB00_14530 [Oleiharenicola lentus]|uniref:YtxH domain-containing protein n=1 Tax=Oleiharenicola lentus TaxID=2508720 RepID=A0A4Q1C3V5_9BACT|nr:hypothetical protein [Oleiharenicola lentus]RXK52925.1 hypothetical protein ESB00_14530 [Oleiharenicola lentus]